MSNTDSMPAEVFPPGEFIRDELSARCWEQRDLAKIMGRPERTVSELISGKRTVTPETAQQLGEAFGTSAQFWLNLESVYRLWKLPKPDDTVSRRARLHSMAPIKEMIRRGWIMESDNVEVAEEQVKRFFRTSSLDDTPAVCAAAARKGTDYSEHTPAQRAWLCRAKQLAETLKVARFDSEKFKDRLPLLKGLLIEAAAVRKVPKFLADSGVRFVVVEHLHKTKIDGACFWLDMNSPAVALSLRYDRIDCFWFTLMHELGHVAAGDGRSRAIPPDIDLIGNTPQTETKKPAFEKAADKFASSFLVPEKILTEFTASVRPRYSRKRVEEFAASRKVHPGLVVGQLQFRGEIPYANLRQYLVKVREYLLESALFDGWGVTSPTHG